MTSPQQEAAGRVLAGVRVLELSHRPAGAYCGRLLRNLGAEVTRLDLPFCACCKPEAQADLAASLHHGKTLAASKAAPAGAFDIVIADCLQDDADNGATSSHANSVFAAVAAPVKVDISDFGKGRPQAASSPLIVSAFTGASWAIGNPGEAPLTLPFDIPDYLVATEAAAAALLGLLLVRQGAASQQVELTSAGVLGYYVGMIGSNSLPYGRAWRRDGRRAADSAGFYPAAQFTSRDGFLILTCRQPSEWEALLRAMGDPPWARDPRLQDPRKIARHHADEVDLHLIRWIGEHSSAEIVAMGERFGFPVVAIGDIGEAPLTEPFNGRGYFLRDESSPSERWIPGLPFQLRRPAPAQTHAQASANRLRSTPEAPLAGLRVVDLTWVWSGPTVTAALADLGAEVLKIEHEVHFDPARLRGRGLGGNAPSTGPEYEASPYFNQLNRGKKSVRLNLATPEGAEQLKQLVAQADMVVESMRPGALDKRGLGYAELSQLNPSLIMLSLSVAGQKGPLSKVKGYAAVMGGLCGLDRLVAYSADEPLGLLTLSLGDPNAASHALAALLGALVRRQQDGSGCYVDLSQTECLMSILRNAFSEAQALGTAAPPGNSHTSFFPHGHFRTAGPDEWMAVSVRTDAERKRLRELLQAELGGARPKDGDDLGAMLAAWAKHRPAAAAVERLQRLGLAASVVNTLENFLDSHWCRNHGLRTTVEHPHAGRHEIVSLPWQVAGYRFPARGPAPLLGADTELALGTVRAAKPCSQA